MTNGVEVVKRSEKSNFSVTCSLLSQYIKEKCSLADLGLGLTSHGFDSAGIGTHEIYRPLTTMSLLPGVHVAGHEAEEESKSIERLPQRADFSAVKAEAMDSAKSQLTIFYGGKILVFDNFPSDKAKDLMQLASNGQNFNSGAISMSPFSVDTSVVGSSVSPAIAKTPVAARAQPNFSNLPIARKASLHRFLEKRKDRINAKAPYQSSDKSASKDVVAVKEEVVSQPWLGLGPHTLNPELNSHCSR